MREFAKAFYKSQAWRRARDAYLTQREAIDGGLCELCQEEPGTEVHHKIFLRPENINDAEIALNPDNFQLLCYECHRLQHEAAIRTAQLAAKRRDRKQGVLVEGRYYVNDDGSIGEFKAHIVWGCPGSGRTKYVREHMQTGDAVINLDLLGRALSMAEGADVPGNIELLALDVRDYLHQRIEARTMDAKAAWIVAGVPEREKRQALAERLKADLIFIPAEYNECYKRIMHDDDRRDKALQISIINKWFKDYEPDLPPSAEKGPPGTTDGVGD